MTASYIIASLEATLVIFIWSNNQFSQFDQVLTQKFEFD